MLDTNTVVTVEKAFSQPVEVVWKAITEHTQMIQWFFGNIPDFKPEKGFETRFNVNAESREFMHLWKIIDVDPYQRIVYDWRYEDITGVGEVIIELFEEKQGTLLRLTNLVTETFPLDIPEFTEESCKAGWEYFICERLKSYLEEQNN